MDNSDLQILPLVIDQKGQQLKKAVHPNLPQFPFVLALIGSRNCGKTTLYTNLLLNPNMLHTENIDHCTIISPTIYNDRSAKHLRDKYRGSIYDQYDDEIIKDLIHYQQQFTDSDKPRSILILDDSVGYKTHHLNFLSTRSRHNNINLIFSVQACKRGLQKTVRNNLTDIIIFRTNNSKEFEEIYLEWGSMFGSRERFKKMYNYATKNKYNFLYLKLNDHPPRALKNFTEDITNKFN